MLLTRLHEIAFLKGLLGAQQGVALPLHTICPSFLLALAFSSLLRFILHVTPRLIFLKLHSHQAIPWITSLSWLPTAKFSHLSTYHAGPWATSQPLHSSRMLHLPLLRNTLSLAAQFPLSLTCSSFPLLLLVQPPGMPLPASLALEASFPAMWISPFSNFQLHFLSVSVASAPTTALHQSSGCFPCRYLSLSILLSLQGSPRSLPLWVPTKPVELRGYTKWIHISRPSPNPRHSISLLSLFSQL